MNILGGLDQPSAGRVTIDGVDLLKLSEAKLNRYRRNKVGFVWQQASRNLIPYLTAEGNVQLPMMAARVPGRERRAWARELLQAVGLYERRRHLLSQLSGGEQQRVAIAVALANKPALLLADEPTGEVDSATAQDLLDVFRRLGETFGLTTVVVTHDPNVVRLVDRVVVIRDGRICAESVRQLSELEEALVGESGLEEESPAPEIAYREYVVLDAAGRLQLPREYMEQLGIGDRAEMELIEDGIVIRPAVSHTPATAVRGPAAVEGPLPPRRGLAARFRSWRRRRKQGSG
jgi:ABC-type lipoprotein export system ATPase subunit